MLAAVLLLQFPYVLQAPFLNEDYIFLEKTAHASFFSLWGLAGLTFDLYRPWSTGFHYWLGQHLFGPSEVGFHLVSLGLCVAVLAAYLALVRRMAGVRTAVIAAAGLAVMGAWVVPVVWVAGVQDLWMLLFALLGLHAFARGRRTWAAGWLALALLSKETAAVMPAVAMTYAIVIERRSPARALRDTWLQWVVTAAWAAVHPMLGGRLFHPMPAVTGETAPWTAKLGTLTSLVNLEHLPALSHWGFLPSATLAAALIAGLLLWASASRRAAPDPGPEPASEDRAGAATPRALAGFGASWAIFGWLPLAMPSLGWHAYYGLFGALGAWLAIALALQRRPALAMAVLVASTLLRGAAAQMPSRDWGTAFYQKRAATFLRFMRADLERMHPHFPAHSRLYFTGVPNNVGFMTQSAPAVRVWYGDSTLWGGYWSRYRPRVSGDPKGGDYFFRFDSTRGWIEVGASDEDVDAARRGNPRWMTDHMTLATMLRSVSDWKGVAIQYGKLARAYPDSAAFALGAALAREMQGDSVAASTWYARVLEIPGADPDAIVLARTFEARWRGQRRRNGVEAPAPGSP